MDSLNDRLRGADDVLMRLESVGTNKLSELDRAVSRISSSMEITPSKITITYPSPKDECGRSRTFSLDEIQQCLDNALMNGATGSESSGFYGPFSVDISTNYALQTIPPPSFKDKPKKKSLKEKIGNINPDLDVVSSWIVGLGVCWVLFLFFWLLISLLTS